MNGMPLVIFARDGAFADLTWTNEKAAAKSVERDELWFLHHGTGRVLPWNGGGASFSALTVRTSDEGGLWYEARLDAAAVDAAPVDAAAAETSAAPGGGGGGGAGFLFRDY